jgi:PAS domain S-box-containing protein
MAHPLAGKIGPAENLFEGLFRFSPDAVVVSDREGRILQVNRQSERLFGYAQDELAGQPVEILIPKRFRGVHPSHRAGYVANPHTRPMGAGLELFGLRKDGSEFPVDIMLSTVDAPGGAVVLSVIRDISQRKRAEQALRRSEAQLRAIFEHSPDAIIGADPQGRIVEVNEQVVKFFGYQRSELIGQPVELLIPERFRNKHPAYRADYQHAARTRPMGIGLELFGLRKDGTEFPVDIMLSPVDTPEGKMVLSVIRDLSEKKRAQQELERRERENRYLEEELYTEHRFEDIIGESPVLKKVLKQVETVAATDVTVLILGETGTGKDLIARAIHQLSSRAGYSLVKLNCAAIPTGLLESELFGHERGSFTGAIAQKIGRLELAHQGSFFLDEVGELPLELQPKILRALQEKEFERVGGTRTIPVDLRLIAATNRDLGQMVKDRQFRGDLYYRLRVFPIVLPPLRERREDIPLLVRYFVAKHARNMDRRIENIPPDVMKALVRWEWPGNIRELENFVERSVILTRGTTLRAPIAELDMPLEPSEEGGASLESAEREYILRVLREAKGVIAGPNGAAARLGVKRTTLNSKLKKLGIQREDFM